MEKARNFWRDLPQGGSRYGSVLTRLFLLLCLLATTQAGWADTEAISWATANNELTLTPTITPSTNPHLSNASTSISLTGMSSTSNSRSGYSKPIYPSSASTTLNENSYASISFQIASGYTFTPSSLSMTLWSYGTSNTRKAKVIISDTNGHSVTSNEWSGNDQTDIAISFPESSFVELSGTVTIKLHLYGLSSEGSGKRCYIKGPIVISGTTAAATPKSDLTTFAFSSTTGENMTVGDADATPHAWTATYGESDVSSAISSDVTYVSSDTDVATIVNGKIHAVAAGTTTITAQLSGNATYNDKTTTNSYTVTVSAAASPLSISTQPVGASYNQNATATALTVAATGGTISYSYQWYRNTSSSTSSGTAIDGETNASYTPSTETVGTTYYYCKVTDSATPTPATVTSNIVAVTVNAASSGNTAANPATSTYGGKTFLDVANTTSNAELKDGSIDFLTYPLAYIGSNSSSLTWYTGGNKKSNESYSFSNIADYGFIPVSGTTIAVTNGYGKYNLKNSSGYQCVFNVTGTSGIAVLGKDANSSTDKLSIIVKEYDSNGDLGEASTTYSEGSTSIHITEYAATTLDPAKYYQVTLTNEGSNGINAYQIRFTKSAATTYTVTCATGLSNGSIAASSATAAEGTVVTITGTPDASYGLGTVTVTEATSGNNVATTGTGNTRTFIMPDENVNVTATFVALPTISKGAEVNGSFTTSPESYAAAGTTVTVNATPNSGYSVGTITVTDGSSNPVTVTDGQFTMPNSNVTVNVTFDVAAVSAGDKWNFTTMSDADKAAYKADEANWNTSGNSSYYYSKFQTSNTGDQTDVISTTIQQIKDLKFTRTSGGSLSAGKVRIYLPTSSADGYLNFNSSNGGLVLPSMTAGTLVTVDFDGTGSSYGIKPTNATTEGNVDITSTITSATRTTTTFKVKTAGEVTISANNSNVRIYKITVGEAVDVAEPTFSKADGEGYDGTTDPLSVTVTTKQTATSPATATTYWAYSKTALDRDALVAAATAAGNTGETATVSKATVNEQDITLYAVTKYETNPGESDNVTYYSDVVSATYPYTGTVTPSVSASNINIQQGQQRTIEPTITMPDGTAFDPENDTANPALTTIYDYFDFTFQITAKSGNGNEQYITVDGVSDINQTPTTGGVVNTKVDNNTADPNNTATVHIVATKKDGFSGSKWPFTGTSFNTDVTVTVIAKTDAQTMSYWWDPQFTVPVTDDDFTLDGSVSVFNKKTITNGRMIYVKPAEGYTVYVAAGIGSSHPTVSKVSGTSKKNGVCYYEYRKNDPTDEYPDAPIDYNGIALLIENNVYGDPSNEWTDANDNTEVKNFYLSLQAYNAAGDPEGSVVRCTFPLTNDNTKRPGNVTYDPAEPNTKRNTAETVLTSGVEGAYVYGKFSSTSTSYNTPTLIQESGINGGQTNVGVFSTEVSNRKISAVQVAKNADNYYYIGKRSTNQYDYLFASEIEMKSKSFNATIPVSGSADNVDVAAQVDKITYYNKDSKADIDISAEQQDRGSEDPIPTEKQRLTYSIQNFNGAEADIDENTGEVTIGSKSGYAVVTITYPGGYSKKVSKRTSTTDEATATYTIYITDPSEQIPTITPNSRNFVDEQEVIVQAPETWSALYMVVDNENDPNYSATTATYTSSGDNKNCFLLNAGEYVRLTLTKTSKVRAFAFDPQAKEYTIGDGTKASKEVTQTYTKLDALKAPTLSPYGTSENPHIRTVKSQTVIATTNDAVAGLEVYYTLDGSEPTPTTGEKYNGSEKITITAASTTIKAIAYDPVEGRISPVTTGVYIYTGTIAQPVFYVSTDNGSNWDAGHTSGTVTVNPSDLIKIETSASGAGIYYTMDGSTPTSGEAKVYEGAFSIVKNTTGKAIAIKDDASSPITTVEFVLAEDKEDLWEATDETTPSGKLPGNDRYVVYGKSEGNASSKAVKYLTATFGGMDAEGWSNKTIGEKTQGTPLNGVGKYSIRTNGDAWDETGAEVKNTANTLHGKTFALPAQGDFVRFEPERDGDLTIWLLQQGGLHYTDDGDFCNQFIRLRPIYMLDEQGNSIAASSMYSAARLSDNWDDLDVKSEAISEGRYGNWVPKGGSQNGVVNKFYTVGESEAIYNMYKAYLTTGGNDISAGDPIAPFEVPTGSVKDFLGTLGLNGTGYVMPSGGNVKYTFPVKGGKTYFLFGYRTKLGVRGFQFKPTSEEVTKSVTVEDATSNMVNTIKDGTNEVTINADEICNVTYTRKFTKDTWAAVTFPFSVSVAQMKKVFGDQVDLIHFDNVSGSKINFKRHWYPMIVAGTPVFIKPSQTMGDNVTFEGVRIEAETVNEVSGEGGYKMTGSFTPGTIVNGDYYISGGKLAVRKSGDLPTKACRSWLTADSSTGARFDLTMGTADAFAEEAWSVIGNPQPFVASDETVVTYINGVQEDGIINNIFDGPTGIYTINGQLIRKDATSLEGLSKGIYIVNGKKIAVK